MKVGDQVVLKSGCVIMTIRNIRDNYITRNLFKVFILISAILMSSCGILETDSTSNDANCVFEKHNVTTTSTQIGSGPVTYSIYHMTTIKNIGSVTAHDVKIIIYIDGSSVGSMNVSGSLSAGQSIDKNFNTTTVGSEPDLKLRWE